MEHEYKVGDMVKLSQPERWLLPWRKFGIEGRHAQIIQVVAGKHYLGDFKIAFVTKRKGAAPQEGWVRKDDVVLL